MVMYKATKPIQQRIMVGIPMTGLLRSEWVLARYSQVVPCNWSQVDMIRWVDSQSPVGYMVADARNIIATEAINGNFEWLLFIDADTAHDPGLISGAVKHATKESLDMLSILAELVCNSFWEKVIQPIPTGLLIFISPLGKVNDPKSKNAFALGPFILIKNSVFKKIGGYEKIRGKIADDVEMAKLLKESGFKIGLARAHDMMKLRMYEKFKDIWEGWSKNIFMGLVQKREIRSKGKQILILLVGLFVVFIMIVYPFIAVILSLFLFYFLNSNAWQFVLFSSVFVWLISLLAQSYVHKKYHIGNPVFSPLYFIGGIITMAIFLNSAVKTLSGKGVKWKDRVYTENQ